MNRTLYYNIFSALSRTLPHITLGRGRGQQFYIKHPSVVSTSLSAESPLHCCPQRRHLVLAYSSLGAATPITGNGKRNGAWTLRSNAATTMPNVPGLLSVLAPHCLPCPSNARYSHPFDLSRPVPLSPAIRRSAPARPCRLRLLPPQSLLKRTP